MSERLFRRLIVLLVAIGFAALAFASATALDVVMRAQSYTALVNHTAVVENALFDLRIHVERIENARRGYMLEAQPRFLEVYREMRATIPRDVEHIVVLTRDNPVQQRAITDARRQIIVQRALTDRSFALMLAGWMAEARGDFAQDGAVDGVRRLRRTLAAMSEREERLMVVRTAEQRKAGRWLRQVLIGVAGLLVLVALATIWLILRYAAALKAAADDLRRLNEGLEDEVVARTTDLRRANDEIQRFAYIVSHDLRSPLVNVMGFTSELEGAAGTLDRYIARVEAETPALVDPDAAAAAREDLPEAIGFIRASTEKMDRLINAILKLSREGRRTIAAHPIDMAALVEGIRDSVRHRLDERDGDVAIEGTLPELVSDRLAVEQILSNLIDNAIKYASPERPLRIVVRGRTAGAQLVYEVADNGRGIDPRDHERVFDLFRRSGAQNQPGEGIGLAHVRALAYRLGGTIACDSALDRGATFRLSLPKRYVPTEEAVR